MRFGIVFKIHVHLIEIKYLKMTDIKNLSPLFIEIFKMDFNSVK